MPAGARLLHWGLPPDSKPRVCAVSYFNTLPLVWGMLHGDQRELFDLSFAIPSECARRLASGRAGIGLVPAIELARQPLTIIPGAGITSHGPVRSILLISKVPFSGIQTLAADSSSRTSVVLARIILSRKYGAEPEILPQAPDLVSMLETADACLIIGDPALLLDPATLPFRVLDLGAEWTGLTGLPMVFAVWAARADLPAQDRAPFLDSLRFGMTHLDDIIAAEAPKRGIPAQLARDYLTRYIRFHTGEDERRSLALFLEFHAALPHPSDLRKVPVA